MVPNYACATRVISDENPTMFYRFSSRKLVLLLTIHVRIYNPNEFSKYVSACYYYRCAHIGHFLFILSAFAVVELNVIKKRRIRCS